METLGAFSLTSLLEICYYYIMKKFTTVEDYLEVIAGYKDLVTNKMSSHWFLGFNPIINLARYDTSVLDSMTQSTTASKALTERQGELACKIVLKYQRQLAAKGIDVSPVEHPVWRVPLRQMDYAHSLYLDNDRLKLKFPYNTKFIDDIKTFKKSSQGVCEFDYELKVWNLGLTEYNLNWAYIWAKQNDFTIDDSVQSLFNLLVEAEQTPYKIELVCTESGLDITNAPNSLREYINANLGGFGMDNLLNLVDNSSILGYTVEEDLSNALIQEYGPRFVRLACNREMRITPESRTADDDLVSVLKYAEQVGSFPVVIYEPDLSNRMLNRLNELYPADQIQSWTNKQKFALEPGVKFIHTIKPIRDLTDIPLLISSAGMVFGGDKQIMIQHAKKIVYVAAEVYNKSSNKASKVVKIAG